MTTTSTERKSANHEVRLRGHRVKDALRLYRQRPDKQWSLTDCASILIMQAEDIREALTHDSHFAQAGFTVLL